MGVTYCRASSLLLLLMALVAREACAAPPAMDLQHYQPLGGDWDWFATQGTVPLDTGQLAFGLCWSHARDPLLQEQTDGSNRRIVGDLSTLYLQGAVGLGVADVSLTFPLHLAVLGEGHLGWGDLAPGPAPGDLALTPRVRLLDPERYPVGLAVAVRLGLPTGDETRYVGLRTVEAAPLVALDGRLGRVHLGLNVGARLRGIEDVADLRVGSALLLRGAVGLGIHQRVSLGAEVYGDVGSSPEVSPFEWLAGVSVAPAEPLTVRFAGGTALGPGLGAPRWRLVAGVVISPRRRARSVDVAEVQTLEASVDASRRSVDVHVVPGGWVDVCEPGCHRFDVEGERSSLSLPADTDSIVVGADGYEPVRLDLAGVPSGEDLPPVELQPAHAQGWLTVTVSDGAGLADSAILDLGDGASVEVSPGRTSVALEPGERTVTVQRVGSAPASVSVTIRPGVRTFARAALEPVAASFPEIILFGSNSHELSPEAQEMLRDVAGRLGECGGGHLSIVGHADPKGDPDRNLRLCRQRADVVVRYLVELGVDPDQLAVRAERHGIATDPGELAALRRVDFAWHPVAATGPADAPR